MKKRAMKKWIPKSFLYCHDADLNYCKWLVPMENASAATKCRTCIFGCSDMVKDPCPDNEPTSACLYLNVVQSGMAAALTDACRLCEATTWDYPPMPRRRQCVRYAQRQRSHSAHG